MGKGNFQGDIGMRIKIFRKNKYFLFVGLIFFYGTPKSQISPNKKKTPTPSFEVDVFACA